MAELFLTSNSLYKMRELAHRDKIAIDVRLKPTYEDEEIYKNLIPFLIKVIDKDEEFLVLVFSDSYVMACKFVAKTYAFTSIELVYVENNWISTIMLPHDKKGNVYHEKEEEL